MKARIAPQKELVLLYGIENDKVNQIEHILNEMGARCKIVERGQLGEKMGVLAGYPGFSPVEQTERTGIIDVDMECLVMAGFTEKRVDSLLAQLRRANIQIPLKAVMTATNQNWTLAALLQELKKEHDAFHSKEK